MPTLSPNTLERVRLALESWQASFGGKLSFFVENHKLSEIARTENAAVLLALELARVAETAASEMSFTAQEILSDPEAVARKVAIFKELQAVASEPEIQAALQGCRDAVSHAAEQLGARAKIQPTLANQVIGGLIHSAEAEMGRLCAHQYAQGEIRGEKFHLNEWLFAFPTMHELVCALARQPVDGLTLCVLLDQEIPEFSLFCWALKTGHTLTILSEDSGLSHRGQKHSRRNPGRDLERRSAGRHYPYSIFEFEETSTAAGTGSQWRIKGMVREGAAAAGSITQHALSAHRVRRISELEPEEITWTLLLALQIHEQYWLGGKKTAELAYTGEMVDAPAAVPQALLEAGTSAGLLMPPTEDIVSSSASPLAQYVPLRLVHLSQEHMRKTGEDGKNWGGPCDTTGRTGRNDWMVHRFSARANYDAVAQSERTQLALPHAEHPGDDDFFLRCARQTKGEPEMPPRPVVALDKEGKLTTHSCILDLGVWNHGKPVIYGVTPFKPDGLYGTRAEIERERFYIARRNEAAAIQAMADQEYAEQGASILRWFQQHVVANIEALKRVIAAGACEVPTRFDNPQAGGSSFTNRVTVRPHNMLRLYGITEDDSPAGIPQFVADLHSGIKKTADWKYQCIEDPAIAGRCAADFTPVDASGIAFLAGVAVSELPEYLQHWRSSNYSLGYTGNSILDLVDPVEKLRNPWTHVHFAVQAHFSKVALNRWRKGLFRENASLSVTLYPQWSPEQLLGLFGARK